MSRVPGTFTGPRNRPSTGTFWNGEPCVARKVTLVVADAPEFAAYWARDLIGERRDAVEVEYAGEIFYLDDDADPRNPDSKPGSGWGKVTIGRGSPHYGHRELRPAPGSVEART